jgi:uncharacterized protein (DUF697 family)
VKIFGREPALILGVVSAILQMLVAFGLDLSDGQTAAINAASAAVLAVITAALTARDQLVPVLVGLAQAAITLGLAFGLDWTQEQVAMVMATIAALAALVVRPQVTAVVAHDGSAVPRETAFRAPA